MDSKFYLFSPHTYQALTSEAFVECRAFPYKIVNITYTQRTLAFAFSAFSPQRQLTIPMMHVYKQYCLEIHALTRMCLAPFTIDVQLA